MVLRAAFKEVSMKKYEWKISGKGKKGDWKTTGCRCSKKAKGRPHYSCSVCTQGLRPTVSSRLEWRDKQLKGRAVYGE
jgi:hypothetical protein